MILSVAGCHSAEDYLSEGQDLSSAGQYRDAIRIFDLAIRENPFLKDAYIFKGQCHEYLAEYDSAIHSFNRLLHFDPDNTAAIYYSGICKFRQNKIAESIDYYNKALDSKGGFNTRDTTSIQAVLDLHKDVFETDEVEFDIPSSEILYDRGMAYYKAGQVKNASYDFTSCIFQKYNPGNSYYMLGLCRMARKERKRAQEAFSFASTYGVHNGTGEISLLKQ